MSCRTNSIVMLVTACVMHLPAVAHAERIPERIRDLVKKHALANGVPPALAHAVVMVESRYNPGARGRGVLGLMQIKYSTAVGLGYQGPPEGLLDPETNIKYGMRYLAGAHRRARGDVCGTVVKYSGGWRASRMNAGQARYCGKAKRFMANAAAYGFGSGSGKQSPLVVPGETAVASVPRKIGLEGGLTQASLISPRKTLEKEKSELPVLAYAPIELENPLEEALPMQPAQRIELGFWAPEHDTLASPPLAGKPSLPAPEGENAEGKELESAAERVAFGHSAFETNGLDASPVATSIP